MSNIPSLNFEREYEKEFLKNQNSGLWKCLFSLVNNFMTRHYPTLASEGKCQAMCLCCFTAGVYAENHTLVLVCFFSSSWWNIEGTELKLYSWNLTLMRWNPPACCAPQPYCIEQNAQHPLCSARASYWTEPCTKASKSLNIYREIIQHLFVL